MHVIFNRMVFFFLILNKRLNICFPVIFIYSFSQVILLFQLALLKVFEN